MDDELPVKVLDDAQKSASAAQESDSIDKASDFQDDALIKEAERPKSKEDIKLEILTSCANNSYLIYDKIKEEEDDKKINRKCFIYLFISLLFITLGLTFILIILKAIKIFDISDTIIIGLLTYIIANIFTILIIIVRYVHDSKYLEMFNTVTQSMLNFLVEDKDKKN